MKIRNLRLATLLVAMFVGAQSTFATDVSTFSDLQAAIENNTTTEISVTTPITGATEALKTFSSTSEIRIIGNNSSISGLGTDGTTTYAGINNTGILSVSNITLKDFSTAITNSGTLTIENVTFSNNTINFNQTAGETTFKGTNTLSGVQGAGAIKNQGSLTLSGDNSGYTGSYSQEINATTTVDGKFFGGNSTISSGTLNWNATDDIKNDSSTTLTMSGSSTLNLQENKTLSIRSGSSIADSVTTNIKTGSNLNVAGGNVTLKQGTYAGTVNLTSGELTIDGLANGTTGKLNATGGTLNLASGNLTIQDTSKITSDVVTTIVGTLNIKTGGSVALNSGDTWTGTVNISDGSLNINNVTNGILNATGGNVTIENGEFTIDSNSNISGADVTVDSPATLIFTKDDTIKNIAGDGTLKADGATLTFDNNTTLGESLTLVSENGSKYIISSNADTILSKVKDGSNNNLTVEINGTDSTTDLNIDGTNISNLDFQNTVNYSGALTNNGEVSNSGTLTMSKSMTGNGTFNNSGNLTITGNQSGFTGDFTQTSGSTTINNNGKISSGDKNINGGSLNITSAGTVDYDNVRLGNNATLSHTTTAEGSNTISSSVVNFTDSGATAKFSGGNYKLSGKIDNGNSNTVSFENSTVTLGDIDFSGNTTYNFKNTTLDLLEESTKDAVKDYTFGNVTTNNATLNFNVVITDVENSTDGSKKLVTDTITVSGTNNPIFQLGKIYITGEENGKRGQYSTTTNVLTGASFATNSTPTITGATTKWQYGVTLANNNQSIALEITNYTDDHTLYDMNDTEGTRFFQFSENDNSVYKIAESLGETKEGTFTVSGNNKTTSVISGSDSYSMFNITSDKKDVNLNISDVTIQDATKTGNGSVVSNESNLTVVTITNTAINKNNATGNGGAIYNGVTPSDSETNNLVITGSDFNQNTADGNGGAIFNAGNAAISGTNFTKNSSTNGGAIYNEGKALISSTFTGNSATTNGGGVYNSGNVTITNSRFTDNTAAQGGAIWNSGTMTLNNVTVDAANGTAKNDIYQKSGDTTLTGTNTIASDITADAGTILNQGTTSITGNISGNSAITNEATLTLTGDNTKHTGTFSQTSGTTTIEGAVNDNTGKFFAGESTISNGTLNWYTENDILSTAKLTMTGENTTSTKLVIGKNATQEAVLSIGNSSSIAENVGMTVNAKSKLNVIDQGTVTINNNDIWNGLVHLEEGGSLTIKDFQQTNGALTADKGELTIDNSSISIVAGSHINREVKTAIQNKTTVNVTGDKVVLDSETGDIWDTTSTIKVFDTGDLTIDNLTQNGTITATGGKVTLKNGKLDIANENSKITEKTTVILNASTTTNVNKKGGLALNDGDTWAGIVNVTDGGLLTINKIKNNNTLTANGGTVNLIDGKITLDNTSSITEATKTIISGDVDIVGATIELDSTDSWTGDIKITDGQLDLNNLNGNGKLTAQEGGVINLNKGNLNIAKGSIIAGNNADGKSSALTIAQGTNLNITGGDVTINENDTWNGFINLKSGTLNIEEENSGILHADGGFLNFTTGKLTIKDGSYINLDVVVDLPDQSLIEILEGGTVAINDNDKWFGEIELNGGVLNYGTKQSGTLTAKTGDMNLLSGSILNIQIPSQVADEVNVDIQKGSLVNIRNDAKFNLDSKDKWSGMINNSGGELTTTNLTNSTLAGGGLQQTSGSSTFKDNSHIYITDENSYIIGGDLNIQNNSSLFLGDDIAELMVNNLRMENNSLLNTMNNVLDESSAENMIVNGNNNVSINIAPRYWVSDKFIINNINSDNQGNIHISDFDFLGLCPIDRHIKLHIFDANSIKNVTFDTTDKEIFTPIGWYDLKSVGGGYFTSNLTRYNPQVFRGQVSTLAMYNNQLAIDDMLLNHVTLQSERFLAQGKNANRYAITAPQFAPYQYKKEDGGLWFKNYVNFETLTMTQNLNVHNTAYGSIIGADFPVINLKRGWEYMPTAYIGYTGAQQSYSNMHMYQNGGQAGYMGTFMKHDFVGSVLAYGGAYYNEMQVAGVKDEAMNWFLGTAAKAAYNIHTSEHFTIQPTAFVSYNFFNKQSWGTDFGTMSMNSGMLNGVNIAPGVNFIYARETWNIYLTLQYMYNINDGVSGNAGRVHLHDIRMRHGYIQYGIGATKTWKDRFNSYVQLVLRNGGRTGIGVQLGAQYLFDWYKPKNQNKKQKSTIKTL